MRRALIGCLLLLGLASCTGSGREAVTVVAPAKGAEIERILYVTNRGPGTVGPFGPARQAHLSFGTADISVPPHRDPGSIRYGGEAPQPLQDFAFSARTDLAAVDFARTLERELHARGGPDQEITLFIHGFNNSFSDALYRMAQMKHDIALPGVPMVYAWPSRGRPLAYEYDRDSTLFSRDGLVELLRNLTRDKRRRIVVVAHSMGAHLLMEALRQIEIGAPGWTKRAVSTVILIAPDIGIDVFRSQIKRLGQVPDPFVVFTSHNDRVLEISAQISGVPQRLGNLTDLSRLSDLPVTFVDVSDFDRDSHSSHFTAVSSPSLIAMFQQSARLDRAFMRGRSRGAAPGLAAAHKPLGAASHVILEYTGR